MRFVYCILLFLISSLKIDAQTISTWAGTGTVTNSGDGSLAIYAGIDYPVGGVFDKYGNYYFTTGNNGKTIRKVDTAGYIYTIAGTTGISGTTYNGALADTSKFGFPSAVKVDDWGNLFIADSYNNQIYKVDSTGYISIIAGNGIAGYSGDGGAATAAMIYNPLDLALDKYGNVYISDNANNRIRKVDTSGIITTIAGTGIGGYNGDGGLADTSKLNGPFGLTIDKIGNLYIADEVNGRVRKVDTLGYIYTIAGNGSVGYAGDGGIAIHANVDPECIASDRIGNIYIGGNDYDDRVRIIDTSGYINTIAGDGVEGLSGDGGRADSAELYGPDGLAIDLCGNLYIGDLNNYRIRKVSFPFVMPTIAIDGADTAVAGSSITLNVLLTGSYGTYTVKWYSNDSLFAITTIPTVTYALTSGTDTITATIISAGGCYDSVTSAPHIVTVSDDAVQQIGIADVEIYPNPAHDMLTITGAIGQAQVSNAIGQVLLTRQCSSNKTVIDISTLPAGMYLLKTTGPDNRKVTTKIVKE